jgi:hypothetical protein
MPKRTKLSITDWGHAKPPDFSVPAPAAKRHDAAAQHFAEAARHYRQAAKVSLSAHPEKPSHHAHVARAHRLHAEQHTGEAAKDPLKK